VNQVQFVLAFGFIIVVLFSAVFVLWAFYQRETSNRLARALIRFSKKWEFRPQDVGGFSWFHLALASLLSLFLEMLMIRWVSAEIPVFAYFKNVVLISSFLGFGLGYSFCRRSINLLAFAFPLFLVVSLIKLPWPALRFVVEQIPYLIAQTSDFDLFGAAITPAGVFGTLAAVVFIVLLFALVALIFVPLGQMVGWSLESASDGVLAYTVNVLASLAGIILYTLLCFWYRPPTIWFALAGLMFTLLLWKRSLLRWTVLVIFLLCLGFVRMVPHAPNRELWSPYQKITLVPSPEQNPTAYELRTNDAWYQKIFNLSPDFVAAHPELFRRVPVEGNAYNIPYHFYPNPPSVLVLGAGTGNDVAAAVRNGAGHVVAVEIDPLILRLGRELHFEHPYDSPRVETVLDDARSYIQNSQQRFDVIVFSLLDSHTNVGYYSNIRTDNYVYTLEALQSAKRLLKPDGVFIVKFWVNTPWIAGRLNNLVSTVFALPPVDLVAIPSDYTTTGRFFIAGSQERIQRMMGNPKLSPYLIQQKDAPASDVTMTTDDWPYFYQHKRGIPLGLAALALTLIAFSWRLLRKTGAGKLQWHFFFLGAGFMLLEAQIVSKMALLFGTTWVVNSMVVGGLLLLIAAANTLMHGVQRFSYAAVYLALLGSLAIGYLVPLERFFFSSPWVKAVTASFVLCMPVFFAGIIFIESFRNVNFQGSALGSNLFGALFGGLLESMSLWTGIKALVVFAAVLYLASYLALRSNRPMQAGA
jgi:SAM-dependent methyltransferase